MVVTAKAASKWTVTKNVVPPGTPPQVDTPYTYKVGITLAAGGTQNLNGVVFTDTLPAGRAVRVRDRWRHLRQRGRRPGRRATSSRTSTPT